MKTVLLIEDNLEIRENTAEILELAGYEVLTAENGKIGMMLAFERQPHLVVCDILMPVMDGFEVLSSLQRDKHLRDTPFIFLTAKTEKADFRKGMEMGADDYITKPFSATDILQAIERRLKKAEKKNQVFSADLNGLGKLMQQVTGKELLLLSEGRDMNMYKKRQYIYSEGNHPSWLFYLQKGKVKAFRRNEDGKELITQLYNEGDFLGYTALLENTTYKDTAEVMEECKVAVVPREDFEELLYSNNEVAVQLARLLARNVTIKEQQLIGLAYNSLRKKVAEALVSLQQKYNPHGTSTFTIDISRDNLAAIAGTATESVVRTLAQFREEGLIDVKSGAVVILDEKKLSSMLY